MNFKAQSNEYTCGTTALHNSLVSLGLPTPSFKKIRRLCNNTKDGTWVKDLIKGGRSLGLRFKRCSRRSKPFGTYILIVACPEDDADHYVVSSPWGVHNAYINGRYVKRGEGLGGKILSIYEVY